MQVVFRLPADLDKQAVRFSREKGRYEPLGVPQALEPGKLAMLLPATVALQVLHARFLCGRVVQGHTPSRLTI